MPFSSPIPVSQSQHVQYVFRALKLGIYPENQAYEELRNTLNLPHDAPRHTLIKASREASGIDEATMAQRCGYSENAYRRHETTDSYLTPAIVEGMITPINGDALLDEIKSRTLPHAGSVVEHIQRQLGCTNQMLGALMGYEGKGNQNSSVVDSKNEQVFRPRRIDRLMRLDIQFSSQENKKTFIHFLKTHEIGEPSTVIETPQPHVSRSSNQMGNGIN